MWLIRRLRFKRYNVVLSLLVFWLVENRAVAVMAMEEQVERELA
ncbi:hypothetical protein [Photobacterium phosphoreum]|nr:hypothetical protein [Photobacterium phosphoreum]